MNSNITCLKSPILTNPFHPLDLSLEDLLRIYKRFQQSRQNNSNLKQQLPIDQITQLISSLKGVSPSYIQSIITQSFIKKSISWNDFLTLLDQQSQIREKILDWLLYDNFTFKYILQKYLPIRQKIPSISKLFEYITYMNIIQFEQNQQYHQNLAQNNSNSTQNIQRLTQKYCLCEIDHQKIILIDINDAKFVQVDKYEKKNEKINLNNKQYAQHIQNKSIRIQLGSKSKIITANIVSNTNQTITNSQLPNPRPRAYHNRLKSQKIISQNSIIYSSPSHNINNAVRSSQHTSIIQDQQSYFKKQRKHIHSVFNIFKQLQIDDSIGLAKITSNKINDRTFNNNFANSIRESFYDKLNNNSLINNNSNNIINSFQNQTKQSMIYQQKRTQSQYQKTQNKLKMLYQQKSKLSYNPYRLKKALANRNTSQHQPSKPFSTYLSQKKPNHDRKQKSFTLKSICLSYEPQISCLAIAYHNFQISILKLTKDLNKTILQPQDSYKIFIQKDHKKNQIIQCIKFYYHSIKGKWYLLVVIRQQMKIQIKSQMNSYVLGYQIQQLQNEKKKGRKKKQNKSKYDYNYIFKCNYNLLQQKKQTFKLNIQKFQAIKLETQPGYGLHIISYNGKYITYKQQYFQNQANPSLSIYWKLIYQQKFKNNHLSLSSICINMQKNKIIFGTNNGNVVLYDKFSRKYKINKITASSIVKLQIVNNSQLYILTSDQKVIIMNLSKFDQSLSFSVLNQDKLHEKVNNFYYNHINKQLWTYGSQIKIYEQEINQIQLHKKRQMNKIYTWRLNKLDNENNNNKKENVKNKQKQTKNTHNYNYNKNKNNNNNSSDRYKFQQPKQIQQIITNSKYFILLTEILQVIIIQKSTLKTKLSFILNVEYDSKVTKLAISPNQKLIAVLMVTQNILIYNIYTQELYSHIKPLEKCQKFISLTFLDEKNQYLLACGTQSGNIILIPYPSVPQKQVFTHSYSNMPINLLQIKQNMLITADQSDKICLWQLPYNVIKNQINVKNVKQLERTNGVNNVKRKYMTKIIGYYMNKLVYFKNHDEQIYQLNLQMLKIIKIGFASQNGNIEIISHAGLNSTKSQILNNQKVAKKPINNSYSNPMCIDSSTNMLYIASNNTDLRIFSRIESSPDQWTLKKSVKIIDSHKQLLKSNDKSYKTIKQYGQIMQIKIVQNQKVVIFYQSGGMVAYNLLNDKMGNYIAIQ